MQSYKEYYHERVVKTSLNIEISTMKLVQQRLRKLKLKYFVTYVRALIQKDLRENADLTMSEFLRIESREVKEYLDPPRKYSGFTSGLMKNSFVNNWFRKK